MGIIYKATNVINGKSYIGQTIKDINYRKYKHKCECKCPLFFRALKKYGYDNFKWEILEECENDLLNDKEIYYISLFDTTNREFGYNIEPGGGSLGKKRSEETCKRISEGLKRRFQDPKNRETLSISMKKIFENNLEERIKKSRQNGGREFYGTDGQSIMKFNTMHEASRITSCPRVAIKKILLKKGKHSRGWVFSYDVIDKNFVMPKIVFRVKNKKFYAAKGDVILEFYDQKFAAKELNCNRTKINSCLHGHRKNHKGWIFYYE